MAPYLAAAGTFSLWLQEYYECNGMEQRFWYHACRYNVAGQAIADPEGDD